MREQSCLNTWASRGQSGPEHGLCRAITRKCPIESCQWYDSLSPTTSSMLYRREERFISTFEDSIPQGFIDVHRLVQVRLSVAAGLCLLPSSTTASNSVNNLRVAVRRSVYTIYGSIENDSTSVLPLVLESTLGPQGRGLLGSPYCRLRNCRCKSSTDEEGSSPQVPVAASKFRQRRP